MDVVGAVIFAAGVVLIVVGFVLIFPRTDRKRCRDCDHQFYPDAPHYEIGAGEFICLRCDFLRRVLKMPKSRNPPGES